MEGDWIVDVLIQRGYSINNSLEELEKAKHKVEDLKTFMNERVKETTLEDALKQKENYMENLKTSLERMVQ